MAIFDTTVAQLRDHIAALEAENASLIEFVKVVDAYAVGLATKEEVLESLDARLGRGPKKARSAARRGDRA